MANDGPGHAADVLDGLNRAMSAPFNPSEMSAIGEAAMTLILARTKAGLDADRKPFVPYSDRYAAERAAKGYATSPVDLARTGHMLGAMFRTIGTEEIRIHFLKSDEATKAAAHNYGYDGVVPRKKWRAQKVGQEGGGYMAKAESMGTQHVVVKKREFMDIRAPEDVAKMEQETGAQFTTRMEKVPR